MRISRRMLGVVAVAGLAFAAGRTNLFSRGQPLASAQTAQEQPPGSHLPADVLARMTAGAPGEHHRQLNALIGDWEGVFRLWIEPGGPPMESRGTVSRMWVLGGRYIHEAVDAEAFGGGGAFHGIGYIGFNNVDGRYETVWLDNQSTGVSIETGTYDPESKIMRTRGTHRDPATGQVMSSRGRLDLSDPDRHSYTGYMTGADGKEVKSFEGVLRRMKK